MRNVRLCTEQQQACSEYPGRRGTGTTLTCALVRLTAKAEPAPAKGLMADSVSVKALVPGLLASNQTVKSEITAGRFVGKNKGII